jgi:HK97 family phage major capsid protein
LKEEKMSLKRFYDAANEAEARVQQIAASINTHFEAGETEKAMELRPSLDAAKAESKKAHELYISMQAATLPEGDPGRHFVPAGGDPEPQAIKDLRASNEYMQEFWSALRVGASPKTVKAGQHRGDQFGRLMNALTETGGAPPLSEGGFLLPVDFDTIIKSFRRLAVDLSQYVNEEIVNTMNGWRAMEVGPAVLPFALIADAPAPVFPLSRLAEMENPAFQRINYQLLDYGGFLPVHNNLLADTPANIMQYLGKWCGRKESLTNTALIWAIGAALVQVPSAIGNVFTAIDTALNVTLDPAVSVSATIFTNQNGFNVMDSMVDGVGRKFLQADPADPTRMTYKGRPIVPVTNAQMPDLAANTAPVCVGDGNELVSFFKGAAAQMDSTNIGGGAWRSNDTEIRYIMRADAVLVDAAAASLIAQAY